MIDYFKKRPMLLCGCIGVPLCVICYYSKTAVLLLGSALITLFLFMLLKRASSALIFAVFMLIVMIVSIMCTDIKINRAENRNTASGEFTVVSEPENHGKYSSVQLKSKSSELDKGTKVLVFYAGETLEYGDSVFASLKLKSVDNKYKTYDYSSGIYLTGEAEDIYAFGKGDFLIKAVKKIRAFIKNTLYSNLEYREAATLSALIMGDRSDFTDDFAENIRRAGVSHVMVVSGMHLAIIIWFITGISEKVFYNRFYKAAAVFITVAFMSALCGFTMSVLRAGLTYIIYAVALLVKRESIPENSLGAAVTFILILSPYAVFNLSFQLSALSTLGIVSAALPITDYINKKEVIKNRIAFSVAASVIVSFSAWLFTFPIVIAEFGCISCVSVITGLLISPAVTAVLSVSVIGLPLYSILPFAAYPLILLSGLITKYINGIIDIFAALPFASVETGGFSFEASVMALTTVIAVLFSCKKRADMLKSEKIEAMEFKEEGGRLLWR